MNNKEFAKVLLCEAVELLNEGGGSRKTKADRRNKEIDYYVNKSKNNSNLSFDKFREIAEYDTKAGERESHAKNEYDREKRYKKYADFNKLNLYKTHERNAGARADEEFNRHRNKVLGLDAERAEQLKEKGSRRLSRIYDAIKGYEKSMGGLHDKVQSEYNKLKINNESIAVLLTEAALLLNEDD